MTALSGRERSGYGHPERNAGSPARVGTAAPGGPCRAHLGCAANTLNKIRTLSSLAPAHYLRRPTTVSTRLFRNKTTIPPVRYYTTKRVQGGMRFTCVRCEHSVSTLDFDTRDGNLRTQAATALNQHASKAHNQPLMYSSLDPQQRIWRA
jgi:hypothetical protein